MDSIHGAAKSQTRLSDQAHHTLSHIISSMMMLNPIMSAKSLLPWIETHSMVPWIRILTFQGCFIQVTILVFCHSDLGSHMLHECVHRRLPILPWMGM